MELLKLSVCMIRHPADTLKAIKAHRSNMSIIPMLVLLLLVVATRFASLFIIHYPFQQTAVSDINFFLEGAIYTVPVLTWGIAFFAMTSIMDGETTLKESLTSASFCMVPLILMQIPFALLTRIMSLDETFFYDLIQIAMWAWVLLLFVMSVKVMNDYSLSSDYLKARNQYGSSDPFGELCKKALSEAKDISQVYDAILIDEAQDFSPSFLCMCYEMLKEPKRLVYAYDELQNLRTQSLPSPEAIFGEYDNGNPRVKFNISEEGKPQQDIILEKCYRNSRPALVTAHALGFGIYRKPESDNESGLVQMFEQDTLWKDIGYEVADGQLEDLSLIHI